MCAAVVVVVVVVVGAHVHVDLVHSCSVLFFLVLLSAPVSGQHDAPGAHAGTFYLCYLYCYYCIFFNVVPVSHCLCFIILGRCGSESHYFGLEGGFGPRGLIKNVLAGRREGSVILR
jgi:hypothetical protein